MYRRGWESLGSAHDLVQDHILSFTDIFAPEVEVLDILGDILIPIITIGTGAIGEAADRSKSIVKPAKKKRFRVHTDALLSF